MIGVELERVAEPELDVRSAGEPFPQLRLERAIELDRVDPGDAVGEIRREDAEARPDLEHDVVGCQLGEPADHAEDVVVDEEVLPELLLCERVHGSEKSAEAFASICSPSFSASSPRASASAATVCTTCAGSFGLPRTGCGER